LHLFLMYLIIAAKKRGKLHVEIITFSTVRVIEKRWEEGHGIMINNLK